MPTSSFTIRRFNGSDTFQAVIDLVDSREEQQSLDYSLATNYPRRVFSADDDATATLLSLGLLPQALLFVQPLDD